MHKAIDCPSCGASLDIHNPGLVMAACEYCGNIIYWNEQDVINGGKQSILPEGFSRLYRGCTGTLNNKRFIVLGRVRYGYEQGFWDEWYLQYESGEDLWLTEDNYELIKQTELKLKAPSIHQLEVYKEIEIENTNYLVTEIGTATCIGIEGRLPETYHIGEQYQFADLISTKGHYALGIEYDNTTPTVYGGPYIPYDALVLDDEGIDW